MHVKLIGAGGVGLLLLHPLCLFLNSDKTEKHEVAVIDGDEYEAKNADRQFFTEIGNKADITVRDFVPKFPNLRLRSVPRFLTLDNIVENLRNGDVIFSCVDNHAVRKLISDRCEDLDNVIHISGGNEYTDGNIMVHIRRDGMNIGLPIANQFHPEIMFPTDVNPADVGCQALIESEPQLVITNLNVAAKMLGAFYPIFKGKDLGYDELYFDIVTGNQRPVLRREVVTTS